MVEIDSSTGIPTLGKSYLGRIGLRPVFSSNFFPQCPLRIEFTWFWPILKEETTPKPNSRNASWYFFTNIGIRVLLNTFPYIQRKRVSKSRFEFGFECKKHAKQCNYCVI